MFGNCIHKTGSKCLERAQKFLEYNSAVLLTDDEELYSLSCKTLLRRKLGWRHYDPEEDRRGTRAQSRAADLLADAPAVFGRLVTLNALDLLFYDYARDRVMEDLLDHLIADVTAVDHDVMTAIQRLLDGRDPTQKPVRNLARSGLDAPRHGFVGFGGHTSECHGLGPRQDSSECQHELMKSACTGLSYKDGECYLHTTLDGKDFYIGPSDGMNWFQSKTEAGKAG